MLSFNVISVNLTSWFRPCHFDRIKVHERNEPYTYSGKPLTIAGEDENHVEEIFDKYVELLDNIATSMAHIPVRLEALEIIALAKIAHQFANTRISEEEILELDKVLVKCFDAFSELEIQLQLEHVTNQKLKAALEFSSVQFIYFTYSQNIQINLLLQSTALVTKYNKELQITIILHFDCKRDKIRIS